MSPNGYQGSAHPPRAESSSYANSHHSSPWSPSDAQQKAAAAAAPQASPAKKKKKGESETTQDTDWGNTRNLGDAPMGDDESRNWGLGE